MPAPDQHTIRSQKIHSECQIQLHEKSAPMAAEPHAFTALAGFPPIIRTNPPPLSSSHPRSLVRSVALPARRAHERVFGRLIFVGFGSTTR
mmetsp:Transcript_17439/g.46504  ORF Transcript_17439/g.46504 Transcript_17439/m.46504 type:complete len:91 (-) Transcript_17439:142-414(-)